MKDKDEDDWPEEENDDIEKDLALAHERNKNKTVEELDLEWNEFLKTLELEDV
ncbi:hypothetical protein IU403_05900 [Aerococcaceae bacterium zg-BR22]|uniref:hypothetical protein n=1 Tax=Aerococcaceae bacterium zg-1292 TaxID=2774330 RepID=UPI00406301FF|nr:hypothetical protein [Aerococcaceae bacterium zg-BR22]